MIIKNLKIQVLAGNSLKMCVGAGFEISLTLFCKAFLPLTLNFVVVSSFVHLRDDNNSTKLKRVKGMENISWKIQWELYIRSVFRTYENFFKKILGSIFWEKILWINLFHQINWLKNVSSFSSHPKFSLKRNHFQ